MSRIPSRLCGSFRFRYSLRAFFCGIVVVLYMGLICGCASKAPNSNAKVARAPSTPEEQPATPIAYEKQVSEPVVKDGLSLTISLDKKVYKPGEDITLQFELKNVSDKEIWIGDGFLSPEYHEAGPGRHFQLQAMADGKTELHFGSGMLTEGMTAGVQKVFRLAPNDAYHGDICLARPSAPGQSDLERAGRFTDGTSRKEHRLGADGRAYSLSLRYLISAETHFTWKPPPDFFDDLLWKGAIRSNPLHFEVNGAQSAIPTAETKQ